MTPTLSHRLTNKRTSTWEMVTPKIINQKKFYKEQKSHSHKLNIVQNIEKDLGI